MRFPNPELLSLLGGEQAIIESPLLQKMMAKRIHDVIRAVLKARFGAMPREVTRLLQDVLDEKKLTALSVLAAQCPDLEAFREALLS